MKLVIVGTGYVGLVTAPVSAEMGNHVVCVDVDRKTTLRVSTAARFRFTSRALEQEVVERNVGRDSLEFTDDLVSALNGAQVAMIAVGTPSGEDGSADLRYVLEVAQEAQVAHMTDSFSDREQVDGPAGDRRLRRWRPR